MTNISGRNNGDGKCSVCGEYISNKNTLGIRYTNSCGRCYLKFKAQQRKDKANKVKKATIQEKEQDING